MAQTPLRLSKSRRVVMIVDLAAPEDREAGAVRHQLNWRMRGKGVLALATAFAFSPESVEASAS